jgi:VWFA-related protein
MWKALDELDQLKDARKAIVVMTDGEDDRLTHDRDDSEDPNADRITFDHLLERASEDDVTIYPIYFRPSAQVDRIGIIFGNQNVMGNDRARIARRQLDQIAEQTGGEIFTASREEDLEGAYQRVAGELHTLYSLAYSPDKLKHNGEFRKISVKLKRENAVARTRRGYYDK